MSVWMLIFIVAVISQRLVEFFIANRNERWMKRMGGIEKGERHYKWFIILHCLFFLSIFFETASHEQVSPNLNYYLLSIFVVTQVVRIWCITSLGRFWNTKVIVIPGVSVIKKGPYKYVNHPNYIIVAIELFVIPVITGAVITAVIFPILHFLLLKVRIPREEKALRNATL